MRITKGSKYSFQKFSQKFSIFIVIEYPGRAMRIMEMRISDIDLIIEDLLSKVLEEINSCEAYIIYGHSMRSLNRIFNFPQTKKNRYKKAIKISCRREKSLSIKRKKILSHVPDNLFWEEVIKMGGIPDESQNHPELIEFYIPILKVDFKAIV
ncbi:hypothetical protein FNW52_16775 [Flavobacterium sp. ZT3R18]|uniref:thioesterase II family protein n=1 Tax=Flavobacterium sp. ZT3R18 TaxID=2594429 RepID=UPI001190C809|nr:hypothetical protein [Flavobacterium sp. ZT3R18]TRX32542.1 hypothetical protein FNW52_16775 [Flavobacterium sp. ZT3R18]